MFTSAFQGWIEIWKCWFFRELEKPEKNLLELIREQTTNSTYIRCWVWESNPGHIGGRRVLSPFTIHCWSLLGGFYQWRVTPCLMLQSFTFWVDNKNYTKFTRPWYAQRLPFPLNYIIPGRISRQTRWQISDGIYSEETDDELENKVCLWMIQKLLCLTWFSVEFFTRSQCALPENIHTLPTEGIEISWGKVLIEDMENKLFLSIKLDLACVFWINKIYKLAHKRKCYYPNDQCLNYETVAYTTTLCIQIIWNRQLHLESCIGQCK